MVLHLERLDISAAPFALTLHVPPQFRRGHLLRLFAGDEHLFGRDRQGDIECVAARERLPHAGENAAGIGIQMPVIQRIIIDAVGSGALDKRFALEMLDRAAVADIAAALEGLDIQNGTGLDLQLHVPGMLAREMIHVFIRKIEHPLTAPWYDPSAQDNTEYAEQRSRKSVWHHQPVITHAGSLHGDDLRVARQLARKENDGDEDEQRTEHIHIIGDEGQVIIEDDLRERDLVLEEIVHLLGQVKDDGDGQYQHNGEKECPQKLPNYIPIKLLQFSIHNSYSLAVIPGITLAFHALKSPARICWRACVTRSR